MNHLRIGKKQLRIRQRGQGMTEYIIITALIAISAIGVFTYFGHAVRAQVGGMAHELTGANAQNDISNAKKAATAAGKDGGNVRGIGAYNNDISE
jgi:Flp pilus assembly pilin Flp